jgi:hypothetical protein
MSGILHGGSIVTGMLISSTPDYPGIDKPGGDGGLEVLNFFAGFINSIRLTNETMLKIDNIRKSIDCGVKTDVTVCFRPGPPPSDVTVSLASMAWTKKDSQISCTSFPITGTRGCGRCLECHK